MNHLENCAPRHHQVKLFFNESVNQYRGPCLGGGIPTGAVTAWVTSGRRIYAPFEHVATPELADYVVHYDAGKQPSSWTFNVLRKV